MFNDNYLICLIHGFGFTENILNSNNIQFTNQSYSKLYNFLNFGYIKNSQDTKYLSFKIKNGLYTTPITNFNSSNYSISFTGHFLIVINPCILNYINWSAFTTECGGGVMLNKEHFNKFIDINIFLYELYKINYYSTNTNYCNSNSNSNCNSNSNSNSNSNINCNANENDDIISYGEILLENYTNEFNYSKFIDKFIVKSLTITNDFEHEFIDMILNLSNDRWQWFKNILIIDSSNKYNFPIINTNNETKQFIQKIDFYRKKFIIHKSILNPNDLIFFIINSNNYIEISGKDIEDYNINYIINYNF